MAKNQSNTSVLLLNPPFKEPIIRDNYCCFTSKSGYLWPPVDLLYLSGNLKDKNIELKVTDAVASKKSWEKILSWTRLNKPDVIICLTGTASFKKDLRGLAKLKKISHPRIYLLGNTPTFRPQDFLKTYPFIDGIIHNFFDPKVKNLVLNHNRHSRSISVRNSSGSFKLGRINYLKRLSEIKISHPPQYRLFPLNKYSTPIAQKKPLVTCLTAFGCPFTCKFCIASELNYYPRNIQNLKKEFDAIKANGIKEIFFQDSTFNTRPSDLKKILKLLIKNKYNFSWSANIHSYYVTSQMLSRMRRAGCHTVQIGVESGNQKTLDTYAPSKRMDKLSEVFQLCRQAGIKTLGYFIIGFPDETPKLAENTINFAEELDPDYASFSVLTPDYGTKLFEESVKEGLYKDKGLEAFDSSAKAVLKNKKFSKKKQDKIIQLAYRRFYLKPKRLIKYLTDYRNLVSHGRNGINLLRKKIIN